MKNLLPPQPGDVGYPTLRNEDEWLIKIPPMLYCMRARVCDVKKYTVLLQSLEDNSYNREMMRRWYKITDIEWVELARTKEI